MEAFKSPLFWKTNSTAIVLAISPVIITIVLVSVMLVITFQASYKTRKQSLALKPCISSQKVNESVAQHSFHITGLRSSDRNVARL